MPRNGNGIWALSRRQKLLHQIHLLKFIQKWKDESVAEALNLSINTVRTYCQVIKNIRKRQYEDQEPDYFGLEHWTMEVKDYYEDCIRKAWNEYARAQTPKEKMACMDRAMGAFRDSFESMQSMGVAPRAKEGAASGQSVVYISSLKDEVKAIDVKPEMPKVDDVLPEKEKGDTVETEQVLL